MGKLIMWNLVTLDGYFEGPGHDLFWHQSVWGEELEKFSIEQLDGAGALLFGRVTYDLMAAYWPTEEPGVVADYMNALPKVVFSRSQREGGWTNTRFPAGDAVAEVAKLKHDTPKTILLFGSADLAASLMPAGLFDEIRLCITPQLLGSGTPLFKGAPERKKLELVEARRLTNGCAILRYAAGPQG